jgi:hypothetical protein
MDTYECMRVCSCGDRRAYGEMYMARCDGQLGHACHGGHLCVTASPDCVRYRRCMRACAHAIGWQSRLCRRLDRRRSRRPSSAVPPVCPAAHARRSNLCARATRLRVVSKLCVFARCAMVLTRACVRSFVCVRACGRACVLAGTCVRLGVCGPSRGTAGTGGNYSSAHGAWTAACALCV